MTGDNTARHAEDIGGQELSYAEVKAIASGNPAVLTLADADAELQRLTLLKKNHLDEPYVARRSVRDSSGMIAGLSERLSNLTADQATTAVHAGDPIAICIRASAREDAPGVLGSQLEALPRNVRETHRVPLGVYRGLRFGLVLHPHFPTEVAGFGLSAPDDPLLIEDVLVVRQWATPVAIAFDDAAVADLFDAMIDVGVPPARFARVWLHTHPGASVTPSPTDEATFARAFGGCDWAVIAVLGRTGRVYARLRFNAGPGGSVELPTAVDWAAWPALATDHDRPLAERVTDWQREYATLVEVAAPRPPDVVRFDEAIVEDPGAVWPFDEVPTHSSYPFPTGDPDALG